jgi:hypothetical protein
MTAQAEIVTGRERILTLCFRKVREQISLDGTDEGTSP